jgi:zinc ribbon protein
MELETGEELIWKGRPSYHLRYPFLAFLSFFGILNINGASLGVAVDAASTILFFAFLIASLMSLVIDKGRRYYLTNRRVIARNSTLLVPDLTNVRMEQSNLGRFRGVGNVYFESRDRRWIVFKHVKDPNLIVRSGLSLRGIPPGLTSTAFCNYCGARIPGGATKCPNCGANV